MRADQWSHSSCVCVFFSRTERISSHLRFCIYLFFTLGSNFFCWYFSQYQELAGNKFPKAEWVDEKSFDSDKTWIQRTQPCWTTYSMPPCAMDGPTTQRGLSTNWATPSCSWATWGAVGPMAASSSSVSWPQPFCALHCGAGWPCVARTWWAGTCYCCWCAWLRSATCSTGCTRKACPTRSSHHCTRPCTFHWVSQCTCSSRLPVLLKTKWWS